METGAEIRLEQVWKSFIKGQPVLSDVTLEIGRSELFGLIGPDGSGKTTLFRILATLLIPDSGSATVCGFDSVKEFRKIRKITGYMPGRFSLYPDLTVEENLSFYATIFGTTLRKNYDLIRDIYLHIEPFRKRLAGRLSGGMKQKLALCCALIHKPRVLFLDEPTTGVDAVSRTEFWDLLKELQKSGITILVSTPYMDEASRCDRVALIQGGKILSTGLPGQITAGYRYPLFAIRTAGMHQLLKDLQQWDQCHSVSRFGDTIHFASEDEETTEGQIMKFLEEKGHSFIYISPSHPTVEDSFLELMTRP